MRHRRDQPEEVFLSHSSRDRAFVGKLAEALINHAVPVWYSATNIMGAQQWHDEIGLALARCDWFVLVLSPNAVRSNWVKHEFTFALNEDRFEGRIVPLLHKRCDFVKLSWTIQSFQLVDFTAGFDAGCRELLKIWGRGFTGM